MGEMADMAIEQGIAQMTDQDYEPDYDSSRWKDVPTVRRGSMYRHEKKTCRYCGEHGFKWTNLGKEGWRLIDEDGELHTCKEYEDA